MKRSGRRQALPRIHGARSRPTCTSPGGGPAARCGAWSKLYLSRG